MTEIKFPTHEIFLRQLASDSYWQVKIMTYDASDNLIYMACHRKHDTLSSAETWYIWKYTWVGGNCTMIEGPLIGSVDGQAALGWR